MEMTPDDPVNANDAAHEGAAVCARTEINGRASLQRKRSHSLRGSSDARPFSSCPAVLKVPPLLIVTNEPEKIWSPPEPPKVAVPPPFTVKPLPTAWTEELEAFASSNVPEFTVAPMATLSFEPPRFTVPVLLETRDPFPGAGRVI